MTALTPLIEADFTKPEVEFSPVSVRNTVANKGGAHAGVSRAGCTVNEPYYLSETCRLCSGLESPRHGPISQSGHSQDAEIRSIEQGPHSIAQGVLINRLSGGRAVIRCNGEFKSGRLIRRKGAGQ